MTQENISDDWADLYNNFFRRDAHQLLAWGYEDARQKINADNEETDITVLYKRTFAISMGTYSPMRVGA